MKKHRIFIAINFSEDIKKKMLDFQREWADLPVRWTKPNNLHLTLIFIGYVDNDDVYEICRLVKEAAGNRQPFEIVFKRICLGPPGQPPRLIWIEGEANLALAQLKDELERALSQSDTGNYQPETRAFKPHITLARIRQDEWRRLSEKPLINQEVSLAASVDSVEVMESTLLRSGAEYSILESVELGG